MEPNVSAEEFYEDMIHDAQRRIATLTGSDWKATDMVPQQTALTIEHLEATIRKYAIVLEAIRANRA